MSQVITAIFEDGILRPLQMPDLTMHQVVSVVILTPRRQARKVSLPGETESKKPNPMSWKDCFATKLRGRKKGPLDLSEVSADALWL